MPTCETAHTQPTIITIGAEQYNEQLVVAVGVTGRTHCEGWRNKKGKKGRVEEKRIEVETELRRARRGEKKIEMVIETI